MRLMTMMGILRGMSGFSGLGGDFVGIHEYDDPVSALGEVDGIYVGEAETRGYWSGDA